MIPTNIKCLQISDLDNNAPILAPNIQQCPQRGARYEYHYKTNNEAKDAYQYNIKSKKLRKYLQGSRYQNIYNEKSQIVDVRKFDEALNLHITLSDGQKLY